MNLIKYLRKQNYDFIDGPVRNHKLLQVWLKKNFDRIQMYYDHVDHGFISEINPKEIVNDALSVNNTIKNEYSFNMGLTALEEVLKSLGMANLDITSEIKKGKSISISYDNSFTKEVPVGEIENYFSSADFRHPNPVLRDNANRDDLVIISGVVYASNLVVEIETDVDFITEIESKLNNIASGKLKINKSSNSTLKMVSEGTGAFPIAVQAHRIKFDDDIFNRLVLVSDNRNFF